MSSFVNTIEKYWFKSSAISLYVFVNVPLIVFRIITSRLSLFFYLTYTRPMYLMNAFVSDLVLFDGRFSIVRLVALTVLEARF